MKKSAIAKWQMMVVVSEFLEQKRSEISAVPRIQTLHQQLRTHLIDIENNAVQLQTHIMWMATRKKKLFTELIENTMLFVGITQSYALAINNRDLWLNVDVKKSDFTRINKLSALNKCEAVKNAIAPFQKEMVDYGLTHERFQAYVAQLNLALEILTEPRRAIAKRASDHRHVYNLIEQTFQLVRFQLDPLMYVFKQPLPHLVMEYEAHRRVIKPGYRSAEVSDRTP